MSGDPALEIMSVDAPPEAIAAFRKAWGLDAPLWIQYVRHLLAIPHGDLGQSMRDGREAVAIVAERVPATLALTVPALLFNLAVGIPAGIYAALHRDSRTDRAVMVAAVAGFTVPPSCSACCWCWCSRSGSDGCRRAAPAGSSTASCRSSRWASAARRCWPGSPAAPC